jgi:GDPmannose 4,6-dehydratase
MKKRALICGISGQDGAYLAKLLLEKGYEVAGTSRDAQMSPFSNLKRLGIRELVKVHSVTLTDFRSVLQCLTSFEPAEVYNLAGQSSVGLSFEQPVETLESVAIGTLNLLEAVRFLGGKIRIYNACSSECFGHTAGAANENTSFRPRSPYAVAKSTAFWEVANYREAYGLHSCSGILFNHESPLRPERFVTQKIIRAACRIADGSKEMLEVGNLQVKRDWGWAPDFVEGMHLILTHDVAEDFVLATGESHSLQEFMEKSFEFLELDWKKHVVVRKDLYRPLDIGESLGNASKAERVLGWKPKVRFNEIIRLMIEEFRRPGSHG